MHEHHTYKTKQRQMVLDFLAANRGRHVTIADIATHMEQMGETIGTSTIYRRLNKLVEEGQVKRYVFSDSAAASFEYIGEKEETGGYHMKCKSCGGLVHLECDLIEKLRSHVQEDHDFELDLVQTVFYGTCSDCRRA